MDLETENRIAAILLKEAAELRRQAEKEGVHVYLQQPKVRGRPNSRFLSATVLGIQQANRAVEVNEMWRIRRKELELNDTLNGRSKPRNNNSMNNRDAGYPRRSTSKKNTRNDSNAGASCSSSKRESGNLFSREDEGLRDEEVEEFLHCRVKRGRGAVGSRMDETGPYLPSCPDSKEKLSPCLDVSEHRVFGPARPSLESCESSEEELDEDRWKKKVVHSRTSEKKHSRKHKSKEKWKDKKKKRKEEKSRR